MPNSSFIDIYDAFQFTNGDKANSYAYGGKLNIYPGGGYYFKMSGVDQNMKNTFKILESMDWVDRQTAALFVEFTLYNPNINLYQYCSILFEMTSTGSLVNSAEFRSLDLNDINNIGLLSFKILIGIIYLLFICIIMAKELKEMITNRWKYFLAFYNYLELVLIGFSWATFAMFLNRLHSSYSINNTLRKSNNDLKSVYINLQYISYCNTLLSYFIGLCTAFATLKFIKLLRFNKRVIIFLYAFALSLRELASFDLMFIICWMSFVQAFYLLFNDQSIELISMNKSMTTCFQIILGKFDSSVFFNSNSVLSPFVFVSYNIVIVFIMVNMFVAILIEKYELARHDQDLNNQDIELVSYLKSLIEKEFNCMSTNDCSEPTIYRENFETLPYKFDQVLIRFDEVNMLALFNSFEVILNLLL